MIGQLISHYKIIEKLGEGGMGEVWLAEDTKLDRKVALKFLPAHMTKDRNAVERFKREAKSAAALNHPNIVTIYEIVEYEGQTFLAMEHVDGHSLREEIENGPIEVEKVVDITKQICEGLEKAHKADIIHRDIKPENILIDKSGRVRILDFGLARMKGVSKLTKESSTLGTVKYMSPEQLRGEEVDHRTDIWSLGVVMYEMLTGEVPFKGEYEQAVVYSILNEEPVIKPVELKTPDISKLLHDLLRKDKTVRINSVSRIIDYLSNSSKINTVKRSFRWLFSLISGTSAKPHKLNKRKIIYSIIVMLVIIPFILIAVKSMLSESNQKMHSASPLSSLRGYDGFPNFSPDGNRIVFSWVQEDTADAELYIKDTQIDTIYRITCHEGNEFNPVWTYDGKQIIFIRKYESNYEIVTLNLQNREEKVIRKDFSVVEELSTFPNKNMLAITGNQSDSGPNSVYLLSLDNGELDRLTSPPIDIWGDFYCQVSPDGEQVAFERKSSIGRGVIKVMRLSKREITTPYDESYHIEGLTWTSNSKEIVFSSNREGDQRLWRMKIRGGKPKPLLLNITGDKSFNPSISIQGNMLAYQVSETDANIYRLDLRGFNPEPTVLISSTQYDGESSISYDGYKIAYDSERSGTMGIWIYNRITGENSLLVEMNQRAGGSARWSPNDSLIAFDSRWAESSDIYVIPSEGGEPKRITPSDKDDTVCWWSKDGKWIFFTSNRSGNWEIWKIPPDGSGSATQVTQAGGYAPQVSNDGRWLYYTKETKTFEFSGIYKTSISGGDEVEVLNIGPVGTWEFWCVGDIGIYYVLYKRKKSEIRCFEFESKKDYLVVQTEGSPLDPRIAPNQDWLVFAKYDKNETDTYIVNDFH
ncbi:hypothetical protein BVY01_00880 [bacterium I07]|nr:hypothetical protein BVY01_00880 [bacterium I07]